MSADNPGKYVAINSLINMASAVHNSTKEIENKIKF